MALPPVVEKVRELCGDGTTSMKEVIDRLTVICEKPINLIEYKESWGALTAFKAEFEDRINVYFPPQKSRQYNFTAYITSSDTSTWRAFGFPWLCQICLKRC